MRIFFIHNPKAGGSALRLVFKALCSGPEAPVFDHGPNIHAAEKRGYGRLRGYDYYAGHYGWDEYRRLSDRHLVMTNFRHPVARIQSLYRYWRHNIDPAALVAHPADIAIVALAHERSFSEFIRESAVQPYIADFHFRQLYASGWESAPDTPRAMERVKARIARLDWYYVAEMPDASLALLQGLIPVTGPIPRVNQSLGAHDQVTMADAAYLRALNPRDTAITAFARALQHQRLLALADPERSAA